MAPFHTWSTLTLGLFPALFDFPVPTKRDDYFGGSTDTVWEQSTQPTSMIGPSPTPPPATWGPYRTFRPGETDNATWGASPAVPAPEWQTMGIPYTSTSADDGANKTTWSYVCPACRQGDLMAFNVVTSGDNDPTHSENWLGVGAGLLTNTPGQATDSLKFYRNGALTQLAGRSGQMFPMLPGKADYTVDWDHTIPVAWTQLATDVHSVWKFSSSRPARADRVPSFELCAPDSNQACSYVPLVFANYDFGANLSGQVSAPGTETFTLTGYHQANESDAPPVTDAAVQVSYDDGTTWSPASSVTKLGGGKFRVSVNQPDPSATEWLRVVQGDADRQRRQQPGADGPAGLCADRPRHPRPTDKEGADVRSRLTSIVSALAVIVAAGAVQTIPAAPLGIGQPSLDARADPPGVHYAQTEVGPVRVHGTWSGRRRTEPR